MPEKPREIESPAYASTKSSQPVHGVRQPVAIFCGIITAFVAFAVRTIIPPTDFPDPDRPCERNPGPPPGFLRFSVALARHHEVGIVTPTLGQTSRSRQSGTVVSGPYRSAISAGEAICDGSVRSFAAGSALVPPSAARSDAVAGST
jgi:hypothetical protein